MEHIVSKWDTEGDLVKELAVSDGDELRKTQEYYNELVEWFKDMKQYKAQEVEFRLVEVDTGREVVFPLQLIADAKFFTK